MSRPPRSEKTIVKGGDWLAVFAAAVLFIEDEIVTGSLFPTLPKPAVGNKAKAKAKRARAGKNAAPKAELGPIIIRDKKLFMSEIGRLFFALSGAQGRYQYWIGSSKKPPPLDLGGIRIPTPKPDAVMENFRRYGYRAQSKGSNVFAKEAQLHVRPNVEKATIIYEALRGLGFRPKQGLLDLEGTTTTSASTTSSTTASRVHDPKPMPSTLPAPVLSRSPIIAPSSKAKAKAKAKPKTSQKTKKSTGSNTTTHRPSPTTVAETGSMTMAMTMPVAGHHRGAAAQAAASTAKARAKARAEGIPKLHNAGRSSSKVATAGNRGGNGRFASGKTTTTSKSSSSIVPTPIAHHAAITALRIATNSAKKKVATGAGASAGTASSIGRSINGFPYGLYTGTTWSDTSGGSIRKQPPVGTSASHFSFGAHHRDLPPPPPRRPRHHRPKRDSYGSSSYVAPPALITIPTGSDDEYPALPRAHTPTIPGLPWMDDDVAPVVLVGNTGCGEEAMSLDGSVDEHLRTLLWPGDDEEEEEDVRANDAEGDDLSAMSDSSPIVVTVAEDDVSSCPSMKCDDDEDAFMPFMD